MSYGFGTTLGTGSSDRITLVHATSAADTTVSMHYNPHGAGGGGFGRMFSQGESGNGIFHLLFRSGEPSVAHNKGGTQRHCGANVGTAFDTWHRIAARQSGVAAPTIFINGTQATLTDLGNGAAYADSGETYKVGNRTANDRNWDGMLAEFGLWNVLLDDEELRALSNGFSPKLIRPGSLLEDVPLVRSAESRKNNGSSTVTGALVQPHPAVIMPRGRFIKPIAAPAAADIALIQPHVSIIRNQRMIAY